MENSIEEHYDNFINTYDIHHNISDNKIYNQDEYSHTYGKKYHLNENDVLFDYCDDVNTFYITMKKKQDNYYIRYYSNKSDLLHFKEFEKAGFCHIVISDTIINLVGQNGDYMSLDESSQSLNSYK